MLQRNRLLTSGGFVAAAAIVIGIAVYLQTSAQPRLVPPQYAAAKKSAISSQCLAENSGLRISATDRSAVELSAISYLVDVPAGTNVDVKIASYSATKVTGSDRYPAQYGNYNFELSKQVSGWVVTGFTRCGDAPTSSSNNDTGSSSSSSSTNHSDGTGSTSNGNDRQSPKEPLTITGTVVCLQPKNTTGPQDASCAVGLKLSDGTSYGLNSPDAATTGSLRTGQKVKVSGTLSQQASQYNIVGVLRVTSVQEL